MEEFDKLVLEILEVIPETNPDGSQWKMYAGYDVYTKQYILDNWGKDEEMTHRIRRLLMRTQLHKASRPGV